MILDGVNATTRAFRALLEGLNQGDDAATFEEAKRLRPDVALMFRAIARFRAGRQEAACEDVREAVRVQSTPLVPLAGAIVLSACGQAEESLQALADFSDQPPEWRLIAADLEHALAVRHGRQSRAIQALETAMAFPQAGVGRHMALAAHLARCGEVDRAVDVYRRLLEQSPVREARVALAELLIAHDRLEEARAEARPLTLMPDTLVDGARLLANAGDVAGAERVLAAGVGAQVACLKGELALWRGETDGARAAAAAAEAEGGETSETLRLRGAASLLDGDAAAALSLFEQARTRAASRADLQVWEAEAILRVRGPEAAAPALRAAREAAPSFPSRLLYVLGTLHLQDPQGPAGRGILEEVREGLEHLAPDLRQHLPNGSATELIEVIEQALKKLKGNRTAHPTAVLEGNPSPVSLPSFRSPRSRAIELQLPFQVRPLEEVVAGFEALIARYPKAPTVRCYLGEVFLWAGEYARAEASFRAALASEYRPRWALIGLGAVAMLSGRPQEALGFYEESVGIAGEGASLWSYRGEARRLCGDLEGAARDLDVAIALHPTRLSAHLNRVLVHVARGEHEAAAQLLARVRDRLPALAEDAARSMGHVLTPGRASDLGVERLATRMLALCRGNRSSSLLTWYSPEGELRSVPRHELKPLRTEQWLGSLASRLEALVGVRTGSPSARQR